jgi:anionic cell wall polymer biosynthesis LytR-Cps2A-Psr (LCP) family protein
MKNKTWLFVIPVFLIGIVLGSFGYTRFFANKTNNTNEITINPTPEISQEENLDTNTDKVVNKNLINILLLGSGGGGHSGGSLSDSIILVSVDTKNKKVGLISIPRDFWFSGKKINEDPSIKDAVTAITGFSVSNYISVDFNGFVKIVDGLGGIEVDIKKAYLDNFYPIKGLENETCGKSSEEITLLHQKYSGFELEKNFTCRYEKIEYGVGIVKMNGESALKYVRSRHGDSDFGRSRRQFEVLMAITKKAKAEDFDKFLTLIKTDLETSKIKEIILKIGNVLDYKISTVQLTDGNVLVSSKSSGGAYILIPKLGINNYSSIKAFILNNI